MIIAPMQSLPIPTAANPWLIRLLTLLLAALAAGSALFWVLKWPAAGEAAPPTPISTTAANLDAGKIARLLGAAGAGTNAAPAPVNVQTRLKLLGVMAQGGSGTRGSALIAVDALPAKPYRVGDRVADELVLVSVKARSVSLAASRSGPETVKLELPAFLPP